MKLTKAHLAYTLVAFSALSNASQPEHGGLTVSSYLSARKLDVEESNKYIYRVAEGILAANALAEQKGSPLFCVPRGFALNASDFHQVFEEELPNFKLTKTRVEDAPVGIVLVIGLAKVFPCSSPSSAKGS